MRLSITDIHKVGVVKRTHYTKGQARQWRSGGEDARLVSTVSFSSSFRAGKNTCQHWQQTHNFTYDIVLGCKPSLCLRPLVFTIFDHIINRSVPVLPRFCSAPHNRFKGNGCDIGDITSSEALQALRPFYLAIHPDLFTQFPYERATNEDSLKKLNSYLDALESECGQNHSTSSSLRPKPIQLTFFIKGGKTGMLLL